MRRGEFEGVRNMGKIYNKKFVWPAKTVIKTQQWVFLQRKYHFTPRELQVAVCICRGCNNKQAAENMNIAVNTAKVYLASPFTEGFAKVAVGDKLGYIDKQGKYIWEPTR